MRKKLLVLGSVLLLISSFLLINSLQKSNFTLFNQVSTKKVETVQTKLPEKAELDFTALLCNETRVPFDDESNTFYVPLDMETDQWEKLEFISGQQEYGILFSEDITTYDKQTVIADGKKFPFTVYDSNSWATYYVVFTGLPIIDLATNEGLYATEEITGTAVFYDTDFSLHGTQQSEYNGHIRGNTSRMYPKKGYKLNLTYTNEYGEEEGNKLSLFDMRKDDDWILYAIYNDDTKLRDSLSMAVWDMFGANAVSETSYYGPKMTYVEVFADNHYYGLHGLMEPVDGKQLDLAEEDYSYKRKNPGGVRYKYDNFMEATDPTEIIEGFEIKAGVLNEEAWHPMAYLSDMLTSSEGEEKQEESQIINEDSVMRMWLFLQIITGHDHTAKNLFYVAKYNDELEYDYQFYFAPWDMDLTWGNVSVGEINPYYTDYEEHTYDDRVYWETADWFIDSNYNGTLDKARELYKELRKTTLTDEVVEEIILDLDSKIRDSGAFQRDKNRWPEGIHAKNCNQLLDYAKKRLNFLDKAIEDLDYFVD